MKKTPVQITPQLVSDISNRNILRRKLSDLGKKRQRCERESEEDGLEHEFS